MIETEFIQLGGVVIVVMVFGKIMELLISKIRPGKGIENQLNMIASNHLKHMYSEMQKQTTQHNKQIEVLTEIKTILNERK